MPRITTIFAATGALAWSAGALAQADYVTIEMSIDVDRPAAEVWEKVGGYCDISVWFAGLDCEITSGEGGIGTVRALAGGRVIEILVAQTELSYGYTQPAVEGEFYDLYHGHMEAKPVSGDSSQIVYTLVYDASNMSAAEQEADMERRRGMFEGALASMKEIAEAD